MSRCKEMRAKNRLPAFNLELVRQQSEIFNIERDEVCNAAMCYPITDINEMLCIGSWRDAADETLLRQHNITHVLNVARELMPEEERHRMQSMHFIKSKCIPISDSLNEELERHFDEAFAFIRNAKNNTGRVLVHCRRGISRSAAIVIAYMMAYEAHTFQSAFEVVYKKRPCISLNLAFIQRLEEYEAHLRPKHRSNNNNNNINNNNVINYEKDMEESSQLASEMSRLEEFTLSEPQSANLEVQRGFQAKVA